MRTHTHLVLYAIALAALSAPVQSQNGEFGLFLGGSYYNGEFNPSKHLVSVAKPAGGIFYDAHLNTRYTFRTIATVGELYGSDDLFDTGLDNFRDLEFNARVIDVSGQLHFNFLSFGNTFTEKKYTPYIYIGLSIFNVNPEITSLGGDSATTAFPKPTGSSSLTSVAVPFGTGFKAILGNFTLGLEWSFRKTFTDKVDGLENQYEIGNTNDDPVQYNQPKGFQSGIFNTNDWYSFIGFTISYRPSKEKNACPTMD